VKLWHGIVIAVAVIAIAALLSMTLGIHTLFAHGTH
jgi:hypothetical protein